MMLKKSNRLLIMTILVSLIFLVLTGCGKSGHKFVNQEPNIRITSYEGYDNSELLLNYADSLFIFQQKIFWSASDPDGVITGFAYRVKDQNGNPVSTPGNEFIDLNGDVTPQNVIDRFGTGWVLHYKPNADQSVPLNDPNARRTIWTSAKYAIINFPSADEDGNPYTNESTFEVIAIDNRGGITPVDPNYTQRSIAWRNFKTTSQRPTCFLSTTKGNPNGGEVGSGIRLSFTMKDDLNPSVPAIPYKFEFKIIKLDPNGTTIISESEWFDTASSPNDTNINKFLLTAHTTPSLSYDIEDDVVKSITKVVSRAYNMGGVVSETSIDDGFSITFKVKAGFRPKTLIYDQRCYALGQNHFVDYYDESSPEVMPFTISSGVQRYATHFFVDMDSTLTALNSTNIKVWLRWGWHGEYGTILASGFSSVTDDPYDKKIDYLLDRETNVNYYSEITHFDIRLDGAPYNYPPLANDPSAHQVDVDDDGNTTVWLRLPLYSPVRQTLVLTSLTSGLHTFEVRCVDLQGEVDPAPAVFQFMLVDTIPIANRNGILIIDDDKHRAVIAPDEIILPKYAAMLADYNGTKDFIKRTLENAPGDTNEDLCLRHFAPSDLQKYKLVIYHNDNPNDSGNLNLENDGLTLYLRSGGSLIISSTHRLAANLDEFVKVKQKTILSYLGIPYKSPPANYLSSSLNTNPFFQQAVGQEGYPSVQLQYDEANEPSFVDLVNDHNGLASVTYFPYINANATAIYRMGIKPVGYPTSGPTQGQFNTYNNQIIGIRCVTGTSRCYTFGFPLSYMYTPDAKAMMNKILSEIM
ncbi:MAG: hypothetical protein WC179_06450 [Candidatus Cloacimonadaceae bacterium]|jgi:hypothetical protein|nr:hypothetical protein [Candidatus Cloacimonadota bacterium]